MIVGVTDGYEKKLLVIWVWYNAQVQGNKLVLSLWYSHKIEYDLPEGIQATCEQDQKWNAIIAIAGIHKQMVGQVAAEIRSFRKPEPYKGKWVRYFDEPVRIKPGKAAAK
jgi:large subunit ribosomal protein L6